MSDVTPPAGDLPPPPPGPAGSNFWGASAPGTTLPPPPPAVGSVVDDPGPYVPELGVPQTPAPRHGTDNPELAGFWRRWWARGITGLAWNALFQIGLYLIALLTLFAHSAAPDPNILLAGLVTSWSFGLLITYLICSRPLATRDGTVGMRQMGLSIRSASRRAGVSKSQAFRRTAVAFLPLAVASGSGWLLLYSPDDDIVVISVIIEVALTGLIALGGLWMLVSPRRQTVWDIVGDTVVVIDREPSWLAVIALVAGLFVPAGTAVSLIVVGADRLQSEFRSMSGAGSAGRYFLYNVPTLVLSVAAIVIGHLAIRATKWESGRAGRGLARTGLLMGYVFPATLVGTLLFGVIYRQVEDRQERSCADTRKAITVAVESYRQLNGVYPTEIGQISGGIYVDDPDLGDRWMLSTSAGAPTYQLTGKGDCATA